MIRLLIWLLNQSLFWAVVGVVFGPIAFFRGFRLLQRKRLIINTPRSTIRAAALGPVEVSGTATGPYTVPALLSRTDCLYYRVTVESNPQRDLDNKKMRELCAPLYLDDGTGVLMIYPAGCELQLNPSSDRSEYGTLALAVAGMSREGPEFAQEYCIQPGDEIYALGTLQENPWSRKEPLAESSELSRVGPGFVSAAEADILRREAFPALNPALPSGAVTAEADQFDLHPSVILMKGRGPFVISKCSEREIVSKLSWKSVLYIWGGPAAALWGLWQILRHAWAAGLLRTGF